MTKEPLYQPGTEPETFRDSVIFGTEYQTRDGQPSHNANANNHNVPCAVCEVNNRSKQLMIPGTYICPSGWTREYYGRLMSESQYHKGRTIYTCVDNYPDLVDGTAVDTNGALFFTVETDCSTGLPCAPYDSRKCTK